MQMLAQSHQPSGLLACVAIHSQLNTDRHSNKPKDGLWAASVSWRTRVTDSPASLPNVSPSTPSIAPLLECRQRLDNACAAKLFFLRPLPYRHLIPTSLNFAFAPCHHHTRSHKPPSIAPPYPSISCPTVPSRCQASGRLPRLSF